MAFEPGLNCVVVNYKTYDELKKFLDSYYFQLEKCQTDVDLTVIDVDVDSDVYEYAKDMLSPYYKVMDFCYLPLSYNSGYGRACNFGATIGNKEALAFFNADTQLNEDTLDKCFNALMADDSWGIVGPLQYDSRGLITHAGIFGTNKKPAFRDWHKQVRNYHRNVQEAVTVMGSALFTKRAIWDEVRQDEILNGLYPDIEGGFLPTPHYYEETAYCYMVRDLGYKVIYYGEAEMVHEWHKSSKVGVVENLYMNKSRAMFRNLMDLKGIERD